MLKGKVTLSLLIGPVVPVPVPRAIVDSLTDIQVTSAAGEPSGFNMNFSFNSNLLLNQLLLLLAKVGPYIRVIIVVNVNGSQKVLMDGVITDQSLTPDLQAGTATLSIKGRDLTAVMSMFDFTGIPYPAMPPSARVALIIAKYAMFGIIPIVIPSIFMDIPIPTKNIPVHQGKDLDYINRLASDAGYVFYITPGPAVGINKAYWGPEIKVGKPQPALNANWDGLTNVTSLSFRLNGEQSTIPIVFIQNELTKAPIPIPIPSIDILNPPLGLIPPTPANFPMLRHTAHLSPMKAISAGLAVASSSSNAVSGDGSLNVVKYGHILNSRELVGVRGVGEAFNGLYYVQSVTHNIKKGEYTQNFTLTRNGLVSTLPRIPV